MPPRVECRPAHPWSASLVFTALLAMGLAGQALAVCELPQLFRAPASQLLTTRPRGVVLADFNRDGILDIAVTTPDDANYHYANRVAVMLGHGSGGVGNGTFGDPTLFSTGVRPEQMVAADFDGDGNLDLATADWNSDGVSILHGNGDGTFAAPVGFPAGSRPYGIVAGDFNHDGIVDLAVADNGAATVSVLIGQGGGGVGNGGFAAPVAYPISDTAINIAAADLNGDGHLDLVATAPAGEQVAVLLGSGSGTFGAAQHYPTGNGPFDLLIRDFNGDGVPDLAVTVNSNGYACLSVLEGTGTGAFGAPTQYSDGSGSSYGHGIAAGDFDQDGIVDLAVTNAVANNVAIFLGLGSGGAGNGAFVYNGTYAGVNFPLGAAAADLSGDGLPDLVVASYGTERVAVMLGGCLSQVPLLVSVRDVPNDQGGRVFLRWLASSLDAPGTPTITGYRVWRRIPPGAAAARARQAATLSVSPGTVVGRLNPATALVDYWEALATLPAEGLQGYGYTAPTTQDSIAGSNPYTAFFVTALTADPTVFYQSNVDSGYSVDNLAPPAPAPFVVVYGNDSNALHWGAVSAPDLFGYRLHRGTTSDFVPGPGNLVVASPDTGFVDVPGAAYYKLTAVDVHGNLSLFAMASPTGPVATLVSLASVEAQPNRIRITWYSPNPGLAATVQRRTLGSDWAEVAQIFADGSGYLRYEDVSVQPGIRYGYRLAIVDAGTPVQAGETWVSTDPLVFALEGVRPNPAPAGELAVQFALPSAGPARLELFDVSGRRVALRDVGSLGSGHHTVRLSEGVRLPAGVYLVRLSQGGKSAMARVVALGE